MHQNKPLNTVIVKDRILLCSQTAVLGVISRLGNFSISVALQTIPAEDKAFQEILAVNYSFSVISVDNGGDSLSAAHC